MKFFIGAVLGAALAVSVSAQTEKSWIADKPSDWIPWPKQVLTVKDGVITASGSVRLFSNARPVDPTKTYTISAEIRQISGLPRNVYVGFVPLDAKGDPISVAKVSVNKGTETALSRPVKKGDKELWIKINKKWSSLSSVIRMSSVIAWNVKEDFSDLPNSNISYCGIKKVETVGNEMKVTLARPFTADVSAGTMIRCHNDGGFMYSAGFGVPGRNDFKRFEGSVKGILDVGYTATSWPKGTKKCHILLMLNWGGQKTGKTEFRNVKLTVK